MKDGRGVPDLVHGVTFTVHRILASVVEEDERWVVIEGAPFTLRTGARQWTARC
ncbi:DUF6192 family protein [Streptomyces sp. R08]|uniref:DUF6192 family protein n=1 Tax=Streptomyces sp. R08 TaxID=3238624 RepID=A0AB39MCD1_9ACTN